MKDHDEPMQEEDGDGINADRRREIEDRCLKLNPRLSKKILVHLQSYQTAIKQYAPLDDEAWESLRASLLQERSAFEEQRSAEADGSGSNGNDQTNRAVQGWPLDDSPEGIQLSNRAKLADYAQAVIANWRGEITAETAPSFAATVLLNCRRQFFADESIRRGKLTLEDMKYIFDTKIRRLTQERRGELLFLCNGCPNNPRWWGFESLVQHFTAKHTFNPRGRPAKVNWMMDWPEIGPFRSDPDQAQLEHPVGMTEVIESPRPARAVIRSHAYSRQSPPLRGSQSFHHSAPASARHPYLGYERDLARRPQLEILAGEAEDAWYQLANIRGIPSSVHVHFVITRTARKYQTRFSETISLQLFLEALCETQAMAPIRAANGLGCLECLRHPGKSIDGVSKADRLFPITSLLQHFDTVHIKRNKSLVLPDWTRDMVRLPHPRVISDLAESEGVDAEKRRFLEDIFPWAFSKNGKHVGGVGKARSTTDSGRGSVVPSGPRHSGSTIASSQAELDASGRHGFPNISQDRLQQIQFAENHGKFNGTRASGGELIGYADISRNPQARIDSQRYPRRDSDHTRQPYDLTRMEPMVASSSRPVELGPISRGYVDPRDHQHHHVQDSAKQGGSHPTDNRRRSRPSAADFMESQARVPRPIEVNPYDDPRLRRYPDIGAQALPRRRSRSPPPIPREYRDPYATHSYESQARGRGIPPLPYPDPRLAYPPPPPPHLAYYGSAGMVDYHDPYRSRPPPLDHGYYAPPPPPPPHLMPPPVGGYYYEQINRPPSPTRYAHSHLAIPDRQPPPPMKDEYADYGRYKNR